jgi:methylated-DNA-[protein]-cysteine S-methyltransferase
MTSARQAPAGLAPRAWNGLTPFQREVYLAVSRIPRGQTRSYQWVAKAIGRPGAARAVGNALNRNPFAPRVPCHRVIRADGALGGFAGGPARKRRLLLQEGWTA